MGFGHTDLMRRLILTAEQQIRKVPQRVQEPYANHCYAAKHLGRRSEEAEWAVGVGAKHRIPCSITAPATRRCTRPGSES